MLSTVTAVFSPRNIFGIDDPIYGKSTLLSDFAGNYQG